MHISDSARRFLQAFIFSILVLSKSFGQGSIQVIPSVLPPYSTLLSEYYSGDQNRLSVTLLNTDAGEPFLQGYLRMTIEGQGVKLQTLPYGNYPTIDLMSGSPVTVSQSDLAPYFNPQHLSGTGLLQNRLPEGFYQFCFEVLEKNTGRLIGTKQCAQAYLTLSDPAFLTLPEKGKVLSNTNPFNLLFQWTPRHLNLVNTEYEFTLVEIWDDGIAPEAAFYTAKPIYTTKVNTPNLFYGPGEPQLISGKKYAWRIKTTVVTANNEQEPFKNDGYSEIYWFKLQGECPPLQRANVVADPRTNKTTLSWVTDPSNIGNTKIDYRKKGTSKWTTIETSSSQTTLTGLDWNTTYEYELGNRCNITDDFAYGSLQTFKTLTQDTNNCVPSLPKVISNREPLAMLRAGDTIYASGFRMRLTQVTGANGNFSGQGYLALLVPTTTTEVSIRAAFTNIGINTDKQLISGRIVSLYDKNEGGIGNLDPITQGGIGVGGVKTGGTAITGIVNVTIDPSIDATVKTVVTGPGDTTYTVTVTGTNDKPVSITTKKLPAIIQDKDGKLYSVDKDGKITPVGQAAAGLLAGKTSDQLNQLNQDKGILTFEMHPDQRYAMDVYDKTFDKSMLFSQQYESLNQGKYRVANKLLVTGSTDKVIARFSNLPDDINEDSIRFVTGKGIAFTAEKRGSTYEVTILSGPAGDAQELYAIYSDYEKIKANPKENPANYTYSLGKLIIATYEPKQLKVTLVPVGNAVVNKEQISERLNAIYNPIGINWTVSTAQAFTSTEWDTDKDGKLDITGAGKYNQYSSEMKALNLSYLRTASVDPSTPYLFIFEKAPKSGNDESGRGILGDMLRNKQFGYLFQSGNNDQGQVTAHELAHGVFHLNHTFDDQYKLKTGDLPKNLMDYSGGDQLVKLQWDAIHAPGLVIGAFEKEGDAQILSYDDEAQFRNLIDNKNRIISSFKPVDPKMVAVPYIDGTQNYVIGGVTLYRFDANTQTYVKSKSIKSEDFEADKDIIVNILPASKDILVLRSVDRCLYTYQHLIFKDPIASEILTNGLETYINKNNWKTAVLFKADNSCFNAGIEAIKANDAKTECTEPEFIKLQQTQVRTLLSENRVKKDANEVANTINSTCITSLRGLSYEEQYELFETIATEKTIAENKEIAILRLMQCIESKNYPALFNALEANSNKLIKNLISEMNDKSIYPWDGDNYTNFVGTLLKMVRGNPSIFLNKINSIDEANSKLYAQIINLDPVHVSNSYQIFSSSRTTRFYKGKYNSATGNIVVQDVFSTATTTSTSSPAGPVTSTTESTVDIADVSPLTPILIRSEDNLDIVSTALNQAGPVSDHVYLVPAIFLNYRNDKIFINNVELAAQLTFDAASIALSGGTALATKISWARRLWALAELADGVTSIAVNTGIIKPTDKIFPAVNIYNTTMGMIGIVDMASKAPKITRQLSNYANTIHVDIKAALIRNQSIKAIILAKYLDWKVAVSNLDGLTSAEKQFIIDGKAAQVAQLSTDQKNAFDDQYKFWKLVDDGNATNIPVNIWDDIILKGNKGITENLLSQYKNIDEYLAGTEYVSKVSSDFMKYQARGGELDLTKYTVKHKVITRNRMQGKIAEQVFIDLEKGFKPDFGIPTSDGMRYVDNLLNNTARELKSGKISLTNDFKRQVRKDLEIIKAQGDLVDKIEWHALDGIDDDALKFIREEMNLKSVSSNDFKVVVY